MTMFTRKEAVMASPSPLWRHQEQAIRFTLDRWQNGHPGVLLAMEMGTGKTRVALEALSTKGCQRILVVAPKSVLPVWREQIARFWRGPPVTLSPTAATGLAHRAADIKATVALGRTPHFCLLNYEVVHRAALRPVLQRIPWDALILDEGHRAKAPHGVQSRAVAALAAPIPHRLALTGTPLPHSHLDAFGLFRALDPHIFGPSYTAFANTYTRPAVGREAWSNAATWYRKAGRDEKPERRVPTHMPEFERKMAPVTFRINLRDVFPDLPPSVDEERYCALEPTALRAYRQMEEQFIADVRAGRITAANAGVQSLRLRQIVAGAAEGKVTSRAKQGALADLLADLPAEEPVVVFCEFHADLDAVLALAHTESLPAELSGRRNELLPWQERTRHLLAVQPQAGGLGIDLTRARLAVWYSLPWSVATYQQAKARLVRPGQTRPVTFVHLLAERTIDEAMYHALHARGDFLSAVVERASRGRERGATRRAGEAAALPHL